MVTRNTEDFQELRLSILKRLFRSYIEGDASLEEVLQEQAKRFEGLDTRLDRVEKRLTLALEILTSGKDTFKPGN